MTASKPSVRFLFSGMPGSGRQRQRGGGLLSRVQRPSVQVYCLQKPMKTPNVGTSPRSPSPCPWPPSFIPHHQSAGKLHNTTFKTDLKSHPSSPPGPSPGARAPSHHHPLLDSCPQVTLPPPLFSLCSTHQPVVRVRSKSDHVSPLLHAPQWPHPAQSQNQSPS